MRLNDILAKLKDAHLKVADLRLADMDRAGDLLIGLMLAAVLTGVTLAVLYGAGSTQSGLSLLH